MGTDTAIYGLCSGAEKCFGGPPESRSGGRDIVDEEQRPAAGSRAGRKAPPGQIETAGSGATGLAPEPVPSQDSDNRFLEPSGNRAGKHLGRRPRFLQSPPRVRRNGNHGVDRSSPWLGCHSRREPFTEWPCEIIAPTVLEGQDGGSEDAVVLTPYHRCPLRQGRVETVQAGHGRVFGRGAAAWTGVAGTRDGQRPAWATQTTVGSGEWMIAVWTHAGKQGLDCRNQRAPRLHGGYRTRVSTELEYRGLENRATCS